MLVKVANYANIMLFFPNCVTVFLNYALSKNANKSKIYIRELTNRRLSHDGAVGSPYSTAPSSCRNLNLRFAVKTTTFLRDRQIFSPFLKFVFIF